VTDHPKAEVPTSAALKIGQRVARVDSDEGGNVVDSTDGTIKVKWDGGSTSYFDRGALGNVRLPTNLS
jgi:hypothetical protein